MVNPKCCNPFNVEKHKNMTSRCRSVSAKIAENAKKFLNHDISNQRICDRCYIKVYRLSECQFTVSPDSTPDQSQRLSPPTEISGAVYQTEFSEICVRLGGSPVKQQRLSEPEYMQRQLQKIVELTCTKVLQVPIPSVPSIKNNVQPDRDTDGESFLDNIKEAFHREKNYQNKIHLLTLIPDNWSAVKIMTEFGATRYMVEKAKHLVKQQGHGSFPGPRQIRPGISSETITLVQEFYKSMDISRQLPGANDFVTVRNADGERIKQQKLLVLCNLSEAYQKFVETHPLKAIGFSKFAELRPKECVLAGKAGTHNVCVCIIHQNNNLLCPVISNILHHDPVIKNETELLKKVSCQNVTWDCCEGHCKECNKLEKNFLQSLKAVADASDLDELTYNYWVSGENTYTLEKITSSVEGFLEMFSKYSTFGLSVLRKHDFIAKQQSKYLRSVKETLQLGEYVVIMDFSENYKFITQNEVQAAYYYTHQATLFPIVAYFKTEEGELRILSYAIISEEKTHDTVAVFGFQTKFINFLRTDGANYPNPRKFYYFSDGAVSQFKNKKNFNNVNYHYEDFNIDCEWNFFATSHGKGPSDGVGGTIKREARAASLRSVGESLINTPREFYEWCKYKSNIKSIHFEYVTKSEFAKTKKKLAERFSGLSTIKQTRQMHQVMPNDDKNFIKTKMFSNSDIIHLSSV